MPTRRCVYIVRGRPCGRPGAGNPPLCEEHEELLAAEAMDEEVEAAAAGGWSDDPFGHAFQRLLEQPPIQQLFERINNAISNLGRPVAGPGPQQPPPRPPPTRTGMSMQEARVTLGLPPDVKLTPEVVKKRWREVSKLFHSDHKGNDETMKRVNVAKDTLLAGLR